MAHKPFMKMSREDAVRKAYKKFMIGNVLIIIGALWGLKELGYVRYLFGATVDTLFWPLALMFGGIFFLVKGFIIKRRFKL